jgi:hypothetical protein
MKNPKQTQIVKRIFLPVDKIHPVIGNSVSVSELREGEIGTKTVQVIRHLDSGEQITDQTTLFKDSLTGDIVDARNTFACTACFKRFSLNSLGKHIQEENKTYCTKCWPEEKKARNRKKVWGFLKAIWNA